MRLLAAATLLAASLSLGACAGIGGPAGGAKATAAARLSLANACKSFGGYAGRLALLVEQDKVSARLARRLGAIVPPVTQVCLAQGEAPPDAAARVALAAVDLAEMLYAPEAK